MKIVMTNMPKVFGKEIHIEFTISYDEPITERFNAIISVEGSKIVNQKTGERVSEDLEEGFLLSVTRP